MTTSSTIKFKSESFPTRFVKEYNKFRKRIFYLKSDFVPEKQSILDIKKLTPDLSSDVSNVFTILSGQKPVEVKMYSIDSTFHSLYIIKSESGEYLFRINILSNYYRDFPFYIDEFMQGLLNKLNIPSLETYSVDLSRTIFGYDFMLMKYLGTGNLSSVSGDEGKNLYFQLGKYIKKLQGTKVDRYGDINIGLLGKNEIKGNYKTWKEFLNINLSQHITKALDAKVINKKTAKLVSDLLLNNSEFSETVKPVILHNDLSPRNIIVNRGKIAAIIDWEDTILGDPLWEIAFVDTFLYEPRSREKFNEFCRGYGQDVESITSSRKYWLYYLRISLVKICARMNTRDYNENGRIIDRERIENALKKLI